MSLASKEALWMRRFLRHIPFLDKKVQPITMYCDNKAAIQTAKNKRFTGKSKHITLIYNHII